MQETKDIKQEVEGYVGNISEIKDDPEGTQLPTHPSYYRSGDKKQRRRIHSLGLLRASLNIVILRISFS